MKTNRIRNIIFFILVLTVNSNAYSQYQNVTIYTPNNTPVPALNFVGVDFTSQQKEDFKNYWLSNYNNRIEYMGEATYKYNCHAYAWHITEGGSQVWINTPGDDIYWNDKSYLEVSNPSLATKISFGNLDDHSAVTTSTNDYFISKWGPSPLFRHHKNDCPYNVGDLHYYKNNSSFPSNLAISGPETVCDEGTYTINNLPSGATVQWSVNNSFLTIVSSQANTATFRVDGNGECVINANVTVGTTSKTLKHTAWSGVPVGPISVSGPKKMGTGGSATFYLNGGTGFESIQWEVASMTTGAYIYGDSNSYSVDVYVGNRGGIVAVIARVSNKCGSISVAARCMVEEGGPIYTPPTLP